MIAFEIAALFGMHNYINYINLTTNNISRN